MSAARFSTSIPQTGSTISRCTNRSTRRSFPDVPPDSHLAYANAPFFILPFTLLSHLPYAWAYLAWLLISILLYCLGFLLVWRTLEAMPGADFSTALLLA